MSEQVKFDSLLRMAVREIYTDQIQSIPAEEELERMLHPTASFKDKINAILHKEKRSETFGYIRKTASKVTVIFLVIFTMSFSTFLTAEAVRESIAATILEWHDKFTRIFIEGDSASDTLPEIRFNYIPEGFELIEEESTMHADYMIYSYADKSNQHLNIAISLDSLVSYHYIDNERIELYSIKIDGNLGTWTYSDNKNILDITKNNIFFRIYSQISMEEIVQIYENIEIL